MMIAVFRVVLLLAIFTIFDSSLALCENFEFKGLGNANIIQRKPTPGRDPVPFGCTNRANCKGAVFREITEEYIFTFLAVPCQDTNPTKVEIFIGTKSCSVGASGNISFPLKGIPTKTFSLSPGKGQFFDIPLTAVPSEANLNQTVNTSIVVDSDEEVVVYGHQRCSGPNNRRATAFSVKRVEDLGTDYWVITHQKEGKSQVGVVATRNDTNISINGSFINETLILNKYETYYFGGTYDLTGTHIVADKPVLVMAGNSVDTAPKSDSNQQDAFYKCLPSTKDWGRNFILVPFDQVFTVKILSSHDNCNVMYTNVSGNCNISLGKGGTTEFESSKSVRIISSEGILVSQFSRDTINSEGYDNPSMLLTPPYRGAGRNGFVFPVFNLHEEPTVVKSFITVWLPPGATTSDLRLDNQTVTWISITDKGAPCTDNVECYSVVRTNVSTHSFHFVRSDKNITAVVHGVGNSKLYSYSLQ